MEFASVVRLIFNTNITDAPSTTAAKINLHRDIKVQGQEDFASLQRQVETGMLLISLQRLRGEYESSSRWDFFPLNSDWFLYFHFQSLSLGLAADFSPFLCSVHCHSSFFFYKTPTDSSLSLFLSFFPALPPSSPCFAHMRGPPQAAVFMSAYGGVGGSGSNNISRRDRWAHSPHSFLAFALWWSQFSPKSLQLETVYE